MMKNNKKVFDKGILITILMLIAAIVYSYLAFFVRGVDSFVDLIFAVILSGLLWFGALFLLYLHIKTFTNMCARVVAEWRIQSIKRRNCFSKRPTWARP